MKVAHLSDVHLLDARTGTRQARYKLATKFVSLGRAIDPTFRARNLARALELAKTSRADHVVISGDLTEVGEQAEYEYFAEVLHDSKLPAESITLVPGNHDAYTEQGWKKALDGPLRPFASSSAGTQDEAGKVVVRGPLALLPIDTSLFQNIAWSGGLFTPPMAAAIDKRMNEDRTLRDKAVALVVHHPPFHPHRLPIVRWLDGLRGATSVLDLLARHPRLQLLHGNLHRMLDRIVTGERRIAKLEGGDIETRAVTRLFGAPATCDGSDDKPARIRLYDVKDGLLHAAA